MSPQEGKTDYGTSADTEAAVPTNKTSVLGLAKTKGSSFIEDFLNFEEGTAPQSFIVAVVIGVICGVSAFVYYKVLWGLLNFVWHTIPNNYIVDVWPESLYVLWIPIVGFTMAVGLGLTVKYLGEPGDLAYTVKCVHEKAYISMDHCMPMVYASQFSIIGGGSLGPEAPLVAICACLGGWVSRSIFKRTNRNTVRKHTLMGMAGALAAFFGSPLGGSLFALEVNSRFGVEYFEHIVESIFCGEVTLCVFRSLAGLPIGPIWDITNPKMSGATPLEVFAGACIGFLGAGVAAIFAVGHKKAMGVYKAKGLLNNENAVQRALVGAVVIVVLGMAVPQTLFWGEYEFQTIATMSPAADLVHVWPTSGLFGFEMTTGFHALIVAVCKLIAISFTVSGGYRGGFIFPFFATGAALGRAFHMFFPFLPIPLCCLSFAAAINVAITRTSLATPIILCFLAGEPNALSGVLAASLISLFATAYMPFLGPQMPRKDMEISLFANIDTDPAIEQEEHHEEPAPAEKAPLVV
jgi:H+/Cl- antiporter ClcA